MSSVQNLQPSQSSEQPQNSDLRYPSEVAEPTRSNTLPQQGNTQPDSGTAVRADGSPIEPADLARDNVNVVEVPPREVPFKERVIGVAKKTRGTLLNNPELKEHGEKILQGTATVHEPASTSS